MDIVKQGVYALFDGEELVYIGQSNSLYSRVGQHIRQGEKEFDNFEIFPLPDEFPSDSLTSVEWELITWFVPKYNKMGTLNCNAPHAYKSKENCIKAIQRIINREVPKHLEKTKQEWELMPPQFCFCKDCAYNKTNRAESAYDMPWQVRDCMQRSCFRGIEMARDYPTFDFDGCMRGLPMGASKYYDSSLNEEQEKDYKWYFPSKYTQKDNYGK